MKTSKKNKRSCLRFLIFLTAAVVFGFLPSLCQARTKTVSAWLAYWDMKKGIANLEENSIIPFDEIYFFAYALNPSGDVIHTFANDAEYKQALEFLRKRNVHPIPTITNDVLYAKNEMMLKNPRIIHDLLSNQARRQQHIERIANLVNELNAEGVDIDYEELYSEDRGLFSLFIKELAQKLRARHKTVCVTVAQKIEDHNRPGPGAIDWEEISRFADKIIIMCYNYSSKSTKPGPICPTFWFEKIINFARTQIPHEKICLALPLHGYDWAQRTATSVNYATSLALSEKYGAAILWDSKAQSPYFTYFSDGAKHTVWFENPKSIAQKLKIIQKYHLNHIAFWHVSILDASFLPSVRTFADSE